MRTFRISFLAGAAIIAVLALLGFYPVALVAAAVLVPLLMVMYVYVVDIYEDEPLSILGTTMLWGVAAGVLYALMVRALPSPASFANDNIGVIALNAVGLPLMETVLMLAGHSSCSRNDDSTTSWTAPRSALPRQSHSQARIWSSRRCPSWAPASARL